MRRQTRYGLIILALAIAALVLWPRVRLFVQVDRCLDSGGAWNDERSACEHGP